MATKQGPDDGEEYERKSNITADISNIYHELNALCVKLDTAKDDLQKGQQKNVDLQVRAKTPKMPQKHADVL